jgi:hypothetical protein
MSYRMFVDRNVYTIIVDWVLALHGR